MEYRVPVTITIETTMVLDTDVDIEDAAEELGFALAGAEDLSIRLPRSLRPDWSVGPHEDLPADADVMLATWSRRNAGRPGHLWGGFATVAS